MITSLRLVDFKNFADETLNLGPFTVIVGANASGKSNIRDAFRFLHGIGRGYSLPEIIGGKYGPGGQIEWEAIRGAAKEIFRYGQSTLRMEIGMRLFPAPWPLGTEIGDISEAGEDAKYSLSIKPEEGIGYRVTDEELTSNSEIIYSRNNSATEHSSSLSELLAANMDILEDGKVIGATLNRPTLSKPFFVGDEMSRGKYLIAASGILREISFLDPVPDLARKPTFPGITELGDGGENLPTILRTMCGDRGRKEVLIDWIRQLTPMDIEDFEFHDDPSGKVHLVMRETSGQSVSAHAASDGTLRFLTILAALLGDNPAGLYFIEEIENGIHPTRLSLLLDLIERQIAKGKIQVIATTHSPELLSLAGDETFESASLVCRLESSNDAVIRRAADLPEARRLRESQGLGSLLAGGWMEDALAFTEGDDEDEAK